MDLYVKCGGCDREGRVRAQPQGEAAKDGGVNMLVRSPEYWLPFDGKLLCSDCVSAARKAVTEALFKRLTKVGP